MVRPRKPRLIKCDPQATYFKPKAIPISVLEQVVLNMDEVEAIRLCDFRGLNQTDAAKQMKISQSTLQRILNIARKKIAEALIIGKAIKINR